MLSLAARQADIININFDLREGRINRKLARTGFAEATDDKLGWIREAAAERLGQVELSVTIFIVNVTDKREEVAAAMASGLGSETREILDTPHFMIGTLDQLAEDLQARRERFGISYVIVPAEVAESLAPVVERLTGT